MNLSIYKPNAKSTGCAARFQISSKEGQEPVFYLNCIQQHSWDASKRTGKFNESRNDPSKLIAVKFNEFELGEFIHSFENALSYSTFHSNDSTKTQIRLIPFDKTRNADQPYASQVKCFGLTIVRNGSDTFKVPIEPGEAVRLTKFIETYFKILDEYRGEEAKSYQKNYNNKNQKNSKPAKEVVENDDTDSSIDDDDDIGF